ncbi:MAG TPA: reductive dehalogenase [bacterium]|nr:reductive dehalogenase [bacterium]
MTLLNSRGINRLKESLDQALLGSKRVSEPTYMKDIVGEIKQWDERDIVFARTDLFQYFGTESDEFKAYYGRHPELLKYDTMVNKLPDLGSKGGIDVPMYLAQFSIMDKISTDSFVDGRPASSKVEILPGRASEKVKGLASVLGAELVGIGPLRQEWVYSHSARSQGNKEGFQPRGTPNDLSQHTNVIALGFGMNYNLIQSAPDFPVLVATAKGYASGAWVSIQLAKYIRMMGYSARAHHFHNYRVMVVPVAVDCGLGELSRVGYLLTKKFGLALRLAAVTTNMPLVHDKPIDIGVQSFCAACIICAEECPIGAITSGDKVDSNGVMKWKLNEQKCYRYWRAVGTDCGICMTVCPWSKPPNWLHRSVTALAAIKGPHQSLLTQAEKLFYGKHKSAPRPEYIDPYKS